VASGGHVPPPQAPTLRRVICQPWMLHRKGHAFVCELVEAPVGVQVACYLMESCTSLSHTQTWQPQVTCRIISRNG